MKVSYNDSRTIEISKDIKRAGLIKLVPIVLPSFLFHSN
jgi:hypothetical protein